MSTKGEILTDWSGSWKAEQLGLITQLEQAIKADDYDQLCIATGQLKAMSNKRFDALPNIFSKLTSDQANESEQSPQQAPRVSWQPPAWTKGLSVRTAKCLVDAGYTALDAVRADFTNCPKSHFTAFSNFGSKCYLELGEFLSKNNANSA